jgi:tetratricopeptide (TPR) repeat protein
MDNSTQGTNDLLVRYLDGELAEAEKQKLEARLDVDVELQEELAALRAAREAVKQYGLREQVAGIHRQVMQEMRIPQRQRLGGNIRRVIRFSISVAASIILIVGAILALNFFSLSPSRVFTDNYHSYELPTTRSGQADESAVEQAYRSKNYYEVTRRVPLAGNLKDQFLVGMSYLELKNPARALESFREIMSTNDSNRSNILQDETEYYLALAYIANGDYDFSLELLEKIKQEPSHTYHERVSAKLIRQVKALKWR